MPDSSTLRIVSLNLWGGRVCAALLDYVREQAPGTDVFCFQEVLDTSELLSLACGFRTTLLAELMDALPEFVGAFDPMVVWDEAAGNGQRVRVPFGLATFARRSLPIERRGAVTVVEHEDELDAVPGLHQITRPIQTVEVRASAGADTDGSLLVANFHGMARPGNKLDTPARLDQSRAIRRVLAEHAGPVVLVGDFNLLPDTESIRLLEQGHRNLVREHAIPTTRSRLNPHFGKPTEQRHADYAFVSPGLEVVCFEVPDVEVSDHLPLVLNLRW